MSFIQRMIFNRRALKAAKLVSELETLKNSQIKKRC